MRNPYYCPNDLSAIEDFYSFSFDSFYNHEVYKCTLAQYR